MSYSIFIETPVFNDVCYDRIRGPIILVFRQHKRLVKSQVDGHL